MLKSIWQGLFKIGGITLQCHVLDDGSRVIEAEDVQRLFEAMGTEKFNPTDDEIMAFQNWMSNQ